MNNYLSNLPKKITNLSKLKILDVSYNKIKILPDKINKLINLQILNLNNNNLVHLTKSVGKLINIKKIYISFNRIIQLPKSLNNLDSLDYICCFNNPINNLHEITIKNKIILCSKQLATMESINSTAKVLKEYKN